MNGYLMSLKCLSIDFYKKDYLRFIVFCSASDFYDDINVIFQYKSSQQAMPVCLITTVFTGIAFELMSLCIQQVLLR